jgi:hypothetical protein
VLFAGEIGSDEMKCSYSTNSHVSEVVTSPNSTPTSPKCAQKAIRYPSPSEAKSSVNLWSYPEDLFLNYHTVGCR